MSKKNILTSETQTGEILELITYNRDEYEKLDNLSIQDLLTEIKPDRVNWLNVDGLENIEIIQAIQQHFNLHALLIEDVLDDQRPKSEEYDEYLFFTLKMLHSIKVGYIDYEQISFVLGHNYLISFQEKEGDLFDAFRNRIRLDQGRVRKKGPDYLLYRLIDIIVDNYYTVLDNVGERIERIEEELAEGKTSQFTFQRIQRIRKELIYLRKAVYPVRDALSKLIKDDSPFIQAETTRFFADVYDHVVHLIDSLETYQDLTASLLDIHINTQNNQLNNVIKVLTIISTIFIPLTFIVGIYGMNFDYMPELRWKYGYPTVMLVMFVLAVGMLIYFKVKKWF
ncbi:MAG: magnesium/cobalt transporter CorA [Cyclobacteriaceae bacterium]|nr:magnesium/cobalt transporter CorA [Cyclobacteriaceae bacterium]MCX7636526.1 magnesium/cobalt transporter CorA [Cyclobacteriaceae bacterium]MDW8330101.1 magnesium/cobalt transporter CorA [Cyclobacteriaceae bacterium]